MKKLRTPPKLPTSHRRKPAPKAATPARSASSNVSGHEYDPETGHLTVTFASGARYRYEGVEPKTAAGLSDATSTGGYLHSHVIGKHDATKL